MGGKSSHKEEFRVIRNLKSIQIGFIPAGLISKDDPNGERAYLSWKITVGDTDMERQYGYVRLLAGSPTTIGSDMLSNFLLEMHGEVMNILTKPPQKE